MLKLILLILLFLPYIILILMYKKFPLAEWAGFFMVTVMWYLYWLTVLDEKTVLFFIGSIGAYLGTLLGGTLAGIVAIRNRKLQKKIK